MLGIVSALDREEGYPTLFMLGIVSALDREEGYPTGGGVGC